MSVKCVIGFVLLVSIVSTVGAQKQPLPFLYFEVRNEKGIIRPDENGFINVPNNERIRLHVRMRVRSFEDKFEMLEIAALNQHPDYFKNRPPPNITVNVRHGTASAKREIPVRIESSGGGKDVTVYDVDATLDILEPKETREKRIAGFLGWMWEQVAKERPHTFTRNKETFIRESLPHYDERYVNNPVGTYEVVARYSPSTAENWRGVLTTKPLKVRVFYSANYFDLIKAKSAGKTIN